MSEHIHRACFKGW